MKKALIAILAFAAAQAAAQTSAPAPVPAPAPEQKAAERRPLNLKLDEPARTYVRETQPEPAKDGLPTLGGGSLNFERQPRDLRPDARGTYPMDSENSRHQ